MGVRATYSAWTKWALEITAFSESSDGTLDLQKAKEGQHEALLASSAFCVEGVVHRQPT